MLSSLFVLTSVIGLLVPSSIWQAEINLTGVRSNDGDVHVFVYNYENQYPDNPYRHFKFEKAFFPQADEEYSFKLDSLTAGTYAIAVFDDENSNGKMDKVLGIPREGYGFSNDGKPRLFSLPRFEDLLIAIASDNPECIIKMRYAF